MIGNLYRTTKSQGGLATPGFNSSVAAVITYNPGTTWTVDINVAVANTLRMVANSVTTDFDLSSSSYDTMGELEDGVNLISGWTFHRAGANRANNTYASDIKVNDLTAATTGVGVRAGLNITWKAANVFRLALAIGANGDPDILDGAAKTNVLQDPWDEDDTLASRAHFYATPKRFSWLKTFTALLNYAGGTVTLKVLLGSTNTDRDGLEVAAITPGATTVPVEKDLNGMYSTQPGDWLIIMAVNTQTFTSGSSLSVGNGGYGEVGG